MTYIPNSTTIEINLTLGIIGYLTADHAASSYGVPVLVLNGCAYGPGDILPETGTKAGEAVLHSFANAIILGCRAADHVYRFAGKTFPARQRISSAAPILRKPSLNLEA
jgi:hypothetical protein